MKRISLEGLLHSRQDDPYEQQHHYIMGLLEEGKIKPLKASGTNGKKPALYREYWVVEKKKDYSLLTEELKYGLLPLISVDYYLSHPESYEQDRAWVLMLNDYLKNHRQLLSHQESINERSFEIWNREKFLTREQGKRILKRCGLTLEFFNIYGTTEPLAYYSHTREVPQNLLILENKDPFYSMRRHLLKGCHTILGVPVGTLIYGAGKGILRSFQDFDLCAEPYMKDPRNTICYFGDLDYEGIGIYENLAETFREQWKIIPFLPAYEAMLSKAGEITNLPDTKELQNRNIKGLFFSYFEKNQAAAIRELLESGKYIPQEILNITDFEHR
ncbi:MAG: hypothetical protein Q4C91_09815 [Eubacteriales bacterium]|nr:hypothetical protein [Eubacteriales bacterium]